MLRKLIAVLAFTPVLAGAQAAPAPSQPAPKPEIFFREPANGATVPATFTVVFGLRNYGVSPAGINIANTGHFHILIDTESPAAGVIIPPADSVTKHYGTGVIETKLTLKPGAHTLRLVLGDFEHRVIGPDLVSAPIKITVR